MDDPLYTFDLLRLEREPWRLKAACRGMGIALFFPVHKSGRQGPTPRQPEGPAYAVCARCPVRPDCQKAGEQIDLVDGVWGGREYRRGEVR